MNMKKVTTLVWILVLGLGMNVVSRAERAPEEKLINPEDIIVGFEQGQGAREYDSNDVPKTIPDPGTTTSTLEITDTGTIADLNVKLDISHLWDEDLDVFLIGPDGTRVELFTDVGANGTDFNDTILDDEALLSITDGSVPFTGYFRPEGNLSDFDEKGITGTWTLEVTDETARISGILNSWSLIIDVDVEPCPQYAPILHVEPNKPSGLRNTIWWEDPGDKTSEYCSNDAPKAIPDTQTIASTLGIRNEGRIVDLDIKVDITHSKDQDLDVFLISPDGTRVELFTDIGGYGDHFTDTILDDEASLSITGRSAPFTGYFRPEGNLSDFDGKSITGTWTLEVTDDSSSYLGTLNYWSLIIQVRRGTTYYAECTNDANFANIIAHSDWNSEKSRTFTGLDPNQTYWYRVKTRPQKTWLQTDQLDLASNILTNATATTKGDVMLTASEPSTLTSDTVGGTGRQYYGWQNRLITRLVAYECTSHCILMEIAVDLDIDPSMMTNLQFVVYESDARSGSYTQIHSNTVSTEGKGREFYGSGPISVYLWAGKYYTIGASWEETSATYYSGEGPSTVVFGEAFGNATMDDYPPPTHTAPSEDSSYYHYRITAAVPNYVSSGSVVSMPIDLPAGGDWEWSVVDYNLTKPVNSNLTVDVLDPNESAILRDIVSGTNISNIGVTSIKLRANLSTNDLNVTPVLHEWSVNYTKPSCESVWSNVVSSDCFPLTYSTYNDWLASGRPACWCAPPDGNGYQCDGDVNGATEGFEQYRVGLNDIDILLDNWKKKIDDPTLDPCADIDHRAEGPENYRVFIDDLNILITNWKKNDADLPGDCPRPE